MAEGGGNGLLYSLTGILGAAFILGGVTLATGQSAHDERLKTVEAVQAEERKAVAAIPVMANEIEHIKDDIRDIDEKTDKILDAIRDLKR